MLSCASLALGCGSRSPSDAGATVDTQTADLAADTPATEVATDVGTDVSPPDAQAVDAPADAAMDAPADVAEDLALDAVIAPDAVDAGGPEVTDAAVDARDVGFSDLPPADVTPDVPADVPDVIAVDATDAAVCAPRAPATALRQLSLGGFGPVLTRDALGFAVLTSRARSTDPGILYFGRYNADGSSRGSAVVSPVADLGRLGGVVWDGIRYQFSYYRSSDRAILLGSLNPSGSLESSPLVVSSGSVADPERAPMSMNTLTGERCVMWRARGVGTSPATLHATLVGTDDLPMDTALDASPSDGYEVLGINHPTYRCLFVWSAGGAIRALGLPGGAATTLVPAAASTTRAMTTVAAVTTADRYVVAWNQQGGDAPGLHALTVDGLVRALDAERRVETLAPGVSVRRLAVLADGKGYDLVTERTDGDVFVQRNAYASDGSALGSPVRVVNVCMPAEVTSERLPVATDGTFRYGAFLELRTGNTVVATF